MRTMRNANSASYECITFAAGKPVIVRARFAREVVAGSGRAFVEAKLAPVLRRAGRPVLAIPGNDDLAGAVVPALAALEGAGLTARTTYSDFRAAARIVFPRPAERAALSLAGVTPRDAQPGGDTPLVDFGS